MHWIERVLFATDFSEASANALEHAALVAAKNKAELHVLHVREGSREAKALTGDLADFPEREAYGEALERLSTERFAALTPSFEGEVIKHTLADDDPAQAIVRYADDEEMDLIVMGTHGRRLLPHLLVGSVAQHVVRDARVSVLVVGSKASHALTKPIYERVLAPVDFSPESDRSFMSAVAICRRLGAELLTLHVIEQSLNPAFVLPMLDPFMDELTERVRRQLVELVGALPEGVRGRAELRRGKPHREIVRTARDEAVDLIVMSTGGPPEDEGWFAGSVTERVLRSAPCPVLVAKDAAATEI